MAIYHAAVKVMSRSAGQSATSAAAYRSAERIVDERTGEVHDYTRRRGVVHRAMVGWDGTREALWNAAEVAETRSNARVARELVVALPAELSARERLRTARQMAAYLHQRYAVAVDLAVHAPSRRGDQRNHHAHLLFTTRAVQGRSFGAKTRVLDDHHQGPREVRAIRERWEEIANGGLMRAGAEARIDHRSLEAQGSGGEATQHLGPHATAMERRGIRTRAGDENRRRMAGRVRQEREAEPDLTAKRPSPALSPGDTHEEVPRPALAPVREADPSHPSAPTREGAPPRSSAPQQDETPKPARAPQPEGSPARAVTGNEPREITGNYSIESSQENAAPAAPLEPTPVPAAPDVLDPVEEVLVLLAGHEERWNMREALDQADAAVRKATTALDRVRGPYYEGHPEFGRDPFDKMLEKAYKAPRAARARFDALAEKEGPAEAANRVRNNPAALGALRQDELRGLKRLLFTPGVEDAREAVRKALPTGVEIWRALRVVEQASAEREALQSRGRSLPNERQVASRIEALSEPQLAQLGQVLREGGREFSLQFVQRVLEVARWQQQLRISEQQRLRRERDRGYGIGW